jgi:hypothetical protein
MMMRAVQRRALSAATGLGGFQKFQKESIGAVGTIPAPANPIHPNDATLPRCE